jgi:hypothetical protein
VLGAISSCLPEVVYHYEKQAEHTMLARFRSTHGALTLSTGSNQRRQHRLDGNKIINQSSVNALA